MRLFILVDYTLFLWLLTHLWAFFFFFFNGTFVCWYTWLSWAFVCLDCKDRYIWVNVLWISWVWGQPGQHTENLSWKRRGMGWGCLLFGGVIVVVRLACKIMSFIWYLHMFLLLTHYLLRCPHLCLLPTPSWAQSFFFFFAGHILSLHFPFLRGFCCVTILVYIHHRLPQPPKCWYYWHSPLYLV